MVYRIPVSRARIVSRHCRQNNGHLFPGGRRLFAKGLKKKRGRKEVRKTEPRGAEHRQPFSRSFVLFLLCCPCLTLVRLRPPHQKYQQNLLLKGAVQFAGSSLPTRQAKLRREYPLVFSRGFTQYWGQAAPENLSVLNTPWLLSFMAIS